MTKSTWIGPPIPPPKGSSAAVSVKKKRLQQRIRRTFVNTAQTQRSNSGKLFQRNRTLRADTKRKAATFILGESPMLKTTICVNRNATRDATRLTSLV